MRDPYEVLGVDRKASASEIKSAYRRLAKKLHPDANKNDPKAAIRFAELNAAHELLGDDEKRRAFDRGEIDAEGKPRFQGFGGFGGGARPGAGAGFGPDMNFESFHFGPEGFTRTTRRGRGGGGFAGFEDILKEAFGGMGARGTRPGAGSTFEAEDFGIGADVHAALTITLPDAARGVTERLRLPTGKEVDVKIPAGITDGQQIRLKGQGMAGQAGAGDVLITVSIAPHPTFTLDGADVGSICRSRSMRPCLARRSAYRRSTSRLRSPFRHGRRAGVHSVSRARVSPPRRGAAIFSPQCASACRTEAMRSLKR